MTPIASDNEIEVTDMSAVTNQSEDPKEIYYDAPDVSSVPDQFDIKQAKPPKVRAKSQEQTARSSMFRSFKKRIMR